MKWFFVAILMVLFITPAAAINFDIELKQLDGTPFKDTTTLGKACEQALLAVYNDERDPATGRDLITPQEKFERWKLAAKMHGEGSLTAEELTMLKKLVGKAYAPAVVGPVWMLLDPALK